MAKLGLVTVLFNSDIVLEGFFKSLAKQTFTDYHLYLIDNTSNDVTNNFLYELSAKYSITNFTHIKNPSNMGVAKGNNQGIELSVKQGTTYTLLLNNDIEFEQPDLLARIITHSENHNEPIVIPKIYFYDSKKIWMAGGKFLMRGTAIHIGEGDDDAPIFDKERYFKYAPTCFMLIDNNVFKSVGLMDEKYFVYYDDTDFMYRASKLGYKAKLLPYLHVYHKVSSLTGGDESLFSIFYGNRNRIYFISKNFKGFNYACGMLLTFTTRIAKYISYNKEQRQKLLTGIKAGFELLK